MFVSLPAEGDAVSAGVECGEIESTKSVSPLLSPVPGVIVAVNADLDSSPELVNVDPYGAGWMVEVEVEGDDVLDGLMTAEQYAAQLG